MAGKNESPRQKMISMMYIVLTALLAMNVSAVILERFMILSKSFESINNDKLSFLSQSLGSIRQAVVDMGNRGEDQAALNDATSIYNEAVSLIKYLRYLKDELISVSGGFDESSGRPKNIKNDSGVANLMLRDDKATELKVKLNNYSEFIANSLNANVDYIALDANDMDYFKNDSNQKGKSFSELNFGSTPLAAANAQITFFESRVLSVAQKAM